MADQQLRFRIGSTFSGEGFKAAQGATKQLNSGVKQAAGMIGSMASSLGGLDQSCARTMGALVDVATNLVTLNVAGLAAQGVMFALSMIFDKLNEDLEEARKRTEALKAAAAQAFSGELRKQFQTATAEASNLVREFDRIMKAANAFNAALQGIRAAEGKGSVLDLQMQKLQAVVDAAAWGGEKLVEAEYDLAIARERASQIQQEANERLVAAEKARTDNDARIEKLEAARTRLIERRCELEGSLIVAEGDERRKIREVLGALQAEEEKYAQQIKDAMDAAALLEAKVEQAKIERVNAEKQGALDVKAADGRLNALKKAEADARQKRLEDENAADVATWERILADATKSLADARAASIKAESEYQAALDRYYANLHANIENDLYNETAGNAKDLRTSGGSSLNSGWARGHQSQEGQRRAGEAAVRKGINDGTIRTMADAARVRKEAERRQRDYGSSREARQERRDDERREQLLRKEQRGGKLSQREKDELKRLNDLKEQRDKPGKDLRNAEKARAEVAKATKEAQKDIAEIKKKLNQLGLK